MQSTWYITGNGTLLHFLHCISSELIPVVLESSLESLNLKSEEYPGFVKKESCTFLFFKSMYDRPSLLMQTKSHSSYQIWKFLGIIVKILKMIQILYIGSVGTHIRSQILQAWSSPLTDNSSYLKLTCPFNLHPDFSRVTLRPDFSWVLSEIFLGQLLPSFFKGGSLIKSWVSYL